MTVDSSTDRTTYLVAQYERGWYVEKPDPSKPLDACCFIEVAGPFKDEAKARTVASALLARRRGRKPINPNS